MTMQEAEGSPPPKRRKVDADPPDEASPTDIPSSNVKGLDRPISPPHSRRKSPAASESFRPTWNFDGLPKQTCTSPLPFTASSTGGLSGPQRDEDEATRFVPSPIQLTRIQELGPQHNIDAVGLKDILGDPMIKDCWNFNFLFDLDFVMQQLDSDARDMVKVKIIHGFWRKDDRRKIGLMMAAERYPNIELLSAYIPDPYGTHHSKMLILFRHDDLVQVVIHTANMIPRDWGNMTQAVWRSPLLTLLPTPPAPSPPANSSETIYPIGSGERFKVDLLEYLKAYEQRLTGLIQQLANYDFSPVRAAFIGSAPSRQQSAAASPSTHTSFGWLGLQEILSTIHVSTGENSAPRPHIIIQISSIATSTPAWHSHFQTVLARHSVSRAAVAAETSPSVTKASAFFAKREPSKSKLTMKSPSPKFNVIFPTAAEIRASLDGYNSGASIHVKLQSVQQQKQLEYLHPLLCHWEYSPTASADDFHVTRTEALRGSAAPHIKTYIRFSSESHQTIDWAMVTSANLSTQAWGGVMNKKDEIWIQSWETGVVLWPALFADPGAAAEDAIMVPVFGKDIPEPEDTPKEEGNERVAERQGEQDKQVRTIVGFRMPYDLPLSPYAANDKPWCASAQYSEPDCKGCSYEGYKPH